MKKLVIQGIRDIFDIDLRTLFVTSFGGVGLPHGTSRHLSRLLT